MSGLTCGARSASGAVKSASWSASISISGGAANSIRRAWRYVVDRPLA